MIDDDYDDYEEYVEADSIAEDETISELFIYLDEVDALERYYKLRDISNWQDKDWMAFVDRSLFLIWGAWQRCGQGIYLGYPSRDIIQKAREGGRSPGKIIYPDNDPAEYLDALICMLTKKQTQSLIAEYIWGVSNRTAGRIFHIDESTHRGHIDAGCRQLVKMLKEKNPYQREMLEKIFV